ANVIERPEENVVNQRQEAINNLLGYKPIYHSKWSEIESNGTQELIINNGGIKLKPKENGIALHITVEDDNNDVVIVNTVQDRDIKYEIDKLILDDLLASTNNNTVSIFGDSQSNNYDAIVDQYTYNSIIRSIMNIHSTDRARSIVMIDGVVHLVPGGIENINKGTLSVRSE
ncbi:MAG: hypothetical protein V3W03_03275, partial [Gammaproteobacteria bacterium]